MKCKYENDIGGYFFGEIGREKRLQIEAHLLTCSACRLKLESLQKTKDAVASLNPAPVSKDFTERLMHRIAMENRPGRHEKEFLFDFEILRRIFKPSWGITFAIMAVCLIIGGLFFRVKQQQTIATAKIVYMQDGPRVKNIHFSGTTGVSDVSWEKEPYTEMEYKNEHTDRCKTFKCNSL